MMKHIFRYLPILLLIIGATNSATAAKRFTHDIRNTPKFGFNGLDYSLQKPLGSPEFPEDEKGFAKHIYFGAGFGGSLLGNTSSRFPKPGYRFNGQIGSWFTPVHGIRLLGKGGILSVHESSRRTWFAGGQVDYMLNLSYLLRGYNPYRKFELIGTVGVEADILRSYGVWGKELGIGSSLQMRFNVAPSIFLFVEPRLGVQTGTRYDGYQNDLYRIKTDMSLSLGLGYRILSGKYRKEGSADFEQKDDDNLYFGFGAGGWVSPRNVSEISSYGTLYAGKWFSSTSGLQISMAGSYKKANYRFSKSYFAFGTLDYVLNLDNALGGYRPNQIFNLLLNVGVGGGISRRESRNTFSPAISGGITGLFRVSPNWAITLHPQVYLAKDQFFSTLASKRPAIASVDLGVRYTIGNYHHHFSEYDQDYEESQKWFITFGAGIGHRFRINYGLGENVLAGFGKRFTPVSSWRALIGASLYSKTPRSIDIQLGLDYLSSITTAMYGYDPNRLFDLQLLLGVYGGYGNYDGPTLKTYGAKAGFQTNFRLNGHLDLYLEPHILISRLPIADGLRGFIPEARANLGLRYRLGTPSSERGYFSETAYGDTPNFVSIAAGPSTATSTSNSKSIDLCGAFDISIGRWFSMVSGAQVRFSNDWTHFNSQLTYLGSLHADYLLNATSLFDRSAERKFHIIGAVGLGVAFSQHGKRTIGLAAYGGVQFRYNLPWNIDIYLEPGATIAQSGILPASYRYSHSQIVSARAMIGASYRF